MNSGCFYVGIDEVTPFGLETEKRIQLASSTEKSTSFYDDLGNGTLHRNVQYATWCHETWFAGQSLVYVGKNMLFLPPLFPGNGLYKW